MIRYYDSCIFGAATNSQHPGCGGCQRVTEVASIEWTVAACRELIQAEFPSATEYLEQFLAYCAFNGVGLVLNTLQDAKSAAKLNRAHKKPLEQMGFGSQDWNHLNSASHCEADTIYTVDDDFFDPWNKANPGAARKRRAVADYITKNLGIAVVRP